MNYVRFVKLPCNLSGIDTVEVMLSDRHDTGAGRREKIHLVLPKLGRQLYLIRITRDAVV